MHDITAIDFTSWRTQARSLLQRNVAPQEVVWHDREAAPTLFGSDPLPPATSNRLTVPKEFLKLAANVAAHRDPERWPLLYTALWRLTHGEPHLLELASDDVVCRLLRMDKAIRRDVHKMHAFVRFRQCQLDGQEAYVAWYRPDHRIVRLAAPFFRNRFAAMRWAIMTPDESVFWDGSELTFQPGLPRDAAPVQDELEELWRAYYRSIFNPARIKLKAMRKEMPARFWDLLPETQIMADMLQEAPARVERMIKHQEGFATSARDFLPGRLSLETLQEAATGCQGCDLYQHATQTVFGVGPRDARLMLVGEQPGDQEDRQGRPFVGPAGAVLDRALAAAGLQRDQLYITNAVKHFSFIERGPRRLHKPPSSRQISACRPWLEAEIGQVKPIGIVCLGATAARTLIGRDFRIQRQRGTFLQTDWADWIVATYHPSALLRAANDAAHDEMLHYLVSDPRQARERLGGK